MHLSLLAELCEGYKLSSSTPNTKLNTPHCTAGTMGKKTTLFVGMLLKDKQQAVCFVKQWYRPSQAFDNEIHAFSTILSSGLTGSERR